ncbi:MAG: transcriptional regulator, partial [Draconibacterium sp.]|nr:transcriptional regulator [Draconibacterium sp.]
TCSYLDNWREVKNGKACIIITKNEGIVFKIVYNRLTENNFLLVSSNKNYSPYEISVSQVSEIWQFETYNSFEFDA